MADLCFADGGASTRGWAQLIAHHYSSAAALVLHDVHRTLLSAAKAGVPTLQDLNLAKFSFGLTQASIPFVTQSGKWEFARAAGLVFAQVPDNTSAARCFEASEDWTEAAHHWLRVPNYSAAARAFEKGEEWAAAGVQWEQAGQILAAAHAFRRAGELQEAFRCFVSAGALADEEEWVWSLGPEAIALCAAFHDSTSTRIGLSMCIHHRQRCAAMMAHRALSLSTQHPQKRLLTLIGWLSTLQFVDQRIATAAFAGLLSQTLRHIETSSEQTSFRLIEEASAYLQAQVVIGHRPTAVSETTEALAHRLCRVQPPQSLAIRVLVRLSTCRLLSRDVPLEIFDHARCPAWAKDVGHEFFRLSQQLHRGPGFLAEMAKANDRLTRIPRLETQPPAELLGGLTRTDAESLCNTGWLAPLAGLITAFAGVESRLPRARRDVSSWTERWRPALRTDSSRLDPTSLGAAASEARALVDRLAFWWLDETLFIGFFDVWAALAERLGWNHYDEATTLYHLATGRVYEEDALLRQVGLER